jgi:hypothetical protein
MIKRLIWLTALAVCLQTGSAFAVPKDFDPHHYPPIAWGNYPSSLLGTGSGFIEGYLKAKTQLFGEVTYPNEEVLLVPNSQFEAWYIKDVAYMVEHPYAKNALQNYPTDLVKYTRTTKSDANGYFRFSGLPDGNYIIWAAVEHEEDSHPTRERTQLAMGADGSMVTVPTYREGLKIRSDAVVIGAEGFIHTPDAPGSKVNDFTVVGEFTCCSAEI